MALLLAALALAPFISLLSAAELSQLPAPTDTNDSAKSLQHSLEELGLSNYPKNKNLGEQTEEGQNNHKDLQSLQEGRPQLHYTYIDRDHPLKEDFAHLGALYSLSWSTYYLTQPETFKKKGSWSLYRHNFGKIVFDKDEPVWNWTIHPISGSQVYLYYRANGYSRSEAFRMTLIQSALFETTTEIYTEPASIQDLFQTPVLGTCLGVFLEQVSLYLLNSQNPVGKVVGHILNPSTLFWFYEGKVMMVPQVRPHKSSSLNFYWEF